MVNVAILGYGGRGKNYAEIIKWNFRKKAIVTDVIDNSLDKLAVAKNRCNLTDEHIHLDFDEYLSKNLPADWLFICTQDNDHYEHTIKAIDKGYNILLEKPVSGNIAECLDLEKRARAKGVKIAVCHVLRYTHFYNNVKKVIDSGVLGDLISIEMEESVGYWHQAHSYVRGDWRNAEESNPMIFAKCCHDLDIMVYLTGKNAKTVHSVGQLNHFKSECAPKGAALRCVDCNVDCPYDARKLYKGKSWPTSRLVPDGMPTKEKVEKALVEGQFGRCVYHCDNNVVDFQSTQIMFDGGINCSLIMSAFSPKIYRQIIVRGTKGHLEGKFENSKFKLSIFGKKAKTIFTKRSIYGHGGGDIGLMKALIEGELKTDLAKSIESHIIAFGAEKSRLNDGNMINLDEFKKSFE